MSERIYKGYGIRICLAIHQNVHQFRSMEHAWEQPNRIYQIVLKKVSLLEIDSQ